MHRFLWSGKDAEGRERAERVEAENAQEAKRILTERGWTELQLLKDEISDVVRKRRRMESEIKAPPPLPDDEAARLLHGRTTYFSEWWKTLLAVKGTIALLAALLALGIFRQRILTTAVSGGGLLLVLFLFPALKFYYSRTKRNYAALNAAKVRGDWQEALVCVDRLKRSGQSTRISVGEVELARNRALALAHLGRLEEALAEFAPFENWPNQPHWLYCSHLAGIYAAGKEYERSMEWRIKLVQEKPDMSTGWIDLASYLAHRMNRPAQAREALARAEKLEVTAMGKPHVSRCHGMILWRENRPAEAKEHLEKALVEFEPFARKPLVEGSILFTKAYLCAVQRRLGNSAEAGKLLKEVETYLTTHQEDELLAACRG